MRRHGMPLVAAALLLIAGIDFVAARAARAQRAGETTGPRANAVRADPIGMAVVNFADLAREEQARESAMGPDRPTVGTVWDRGRYIEPEVSVDRAAAARAPHDFIPGPQVPSPSPARSFLGLDDIPQVGTSISNIPPDTEGAVGPTRVFTTLNNNYRVQDRDGATINTVSIATFWASTGAGSPFDPKTVYDPYNNRFLVSAVSNADSATSSILLGVSNTNDPNGTWTLYRYLACDATRPCMAVGSSTVTDFWADYPELGFNVNWAAVSVNMFVRSGFTNGGFFTQSRIFTVNYATLRSGVSPIATFFTGLNDFTIVPVVTYSSSEATLYAPTHVSSAGRSYRLNTITGTADVPIYTQGALKTHTLVSAWVQPLGDILPQSSEPGTGTVRSIDVGDSRIINAQFRNNAIWYAQNVGLPAGGPITRVAAQWVKLDTSGNTLDVGRVDDPTATSTNGGKWYGYPSIAVNMNNDALLGFTQFSSAQFPSAGYTYRMSADAAGTMRDPVIAKAGIGFYFKTYTGTRNRWGDYSASQVDPVDDVAFWTVQEYSLAQVGTGNGSGRWSTWWAQVTGNVFTDDPLVAGVTQIKALHITELRTRIDAVRTARGLAAYSWSTVVAGTTVVQAAHIIQMRQALQEAYTAAGVPPPTYSTSPAVGVPIVVADIAELRSAVVAIE